MAHEAKNYLIEIIDYNFCHIPEKYPYRVIDNKVKVC